MTESAINDVSDTAFWIAYHRALETARDDALFRDPFAARLAGERGRRISDSMPTSRMVAWTVALRTRIIDEFIQSVIAGGADTILNLGAGLDARPYRMTLPASLHWIEADYAHIIDYKEEQLRGEQPQCHLERVRIDLADDTTRQALLDKTNAGARQVLVLTEGVVPYLTNEAAGQLATELHAMDRAQHWILDYFSAEALKYRRRGPVDSVMRNAPFQFEPGDWFAFFSQRGWRPREMRYFADEARRHSRPMPLPGYMKAAFQLTRLLVPKEKLEAMRKFAGYALMERTQAGVQGAAMADKWPIS